MARFASSETCTLKRMRPLLVIIGPTASGKSDLAVSLAERYGGEVISADSRQVYRGLDRTTGKIAEEEMRGIPHHLLSVVDPGGIYSAHAFAEDASRLVREINRRGRLPVIAGGTGFYLEALLFRGATSGVSRDDLFRKKIEKKNLRSLQTDLRRLDPAAYDRIDARNPRRIIRALEVIREIGIFPPRKRVARHRYTMVGIEHDTVRLKDRIRRRLDDRFAGMTSEIKRLLDDGVDPAWLDSLGLECRHITRMLAEHIDEKTTRKNLFNAIVAYAKRQRTWWKRYPEAVWYRENEHKKMRSDLDATYGRAGGSTRT